MRIENTNRFDEMMLAVLDDSDCDVWQDYVMILRGRYYGFFLKKNDFFYDSFFGEDL